MKLGRVHSWKKELAQYILLGLPTFILMAYVLKLANQYFAFLENDWKQQSINFGIGLLVATGIFARRFRFITITAIMITAMVFLYKTLGRVYTGEFDTFFWSVKFLNTSVLFSAGWLVGYGLSRTRFFSIFWSLLLLTAATVIISKVADIKTDAIIATFAPVLAYGFYIIYMSELIRNMNEDEPKFVWFLIKRLAGFGVVIALMILGLLSFFKHDFDAIEKEWGGGKPSEGKDGGTMTKRDGGGVSTANNMGLSGMNNKANKDSVLFVAKLDNYFPNSNIPNPLYFTTDYFTKFDTETQTFEIDSLRPYNDLFSPDVSKLPLFFTKQDTSVIRKGLSDKNRKVITAEVYKHNLSAKLYTAPSTAFFVQPISVPEENKYIYNTAYRAKMYVSDLNSAYFVYNPANDVQLKKFQEQRFAALRKAGNYNLLPGDFMRYYTQMPSGAEYDSIKILARQIVAKAKASTPVDQIIALRDYFLAKDENGQPTFRYSDNPGIPGMPSANKLTYFLFQNKKGYCAYYAGATLFLMRALGIPSRVATGFLTVDRSSKNPGWYWFYEDQAHAWVQAFFPGYGWIDFDTTVSDAEQQQSPQPDQTPPLTSQTAWLVANGKAISIDTTTQRATMQVEKLLYWDNPYEMKPATPMLMDVSLARISRDSGQVSLKDLQPGDEIVSVSYSEQFKNIQPKETDSGLSLLKRFPHPSPIDEIKIMAKDEQPQTTKETATKSSPTNWRNVFLNTVGIILLAIVLLLSLPWLIFRYLHSRAVNTRAMESKAYWCFMASSYYLHQMDYERGQLTSLQFAQNIIDPRFGTQLTRFMNTFLKTKYSRQPLNEYDAKVILEHYPAFYHQLRQQLSAQYRFTHFLNFYKPLQFFAKPKIK